MDRMITLKRFIDNCGGYVLDDGCGETEPLLISNTTKTVALDIAKSGLKNLKHKGFKGHLIQASCTHLPFKGKIFEKTICSEVIEHLPSLIHIKQSINEIIRTSSAYMITTPNNKAWSKWLDPTHYHFFSIATIINLIRNCNIPNCNVSTTQLSDTLLPRILAKKKWFAWIDVRLKGMEVKRLRITNKRFGKKLLRFKAKISGGTFLVLQGTNMSRRKGDIAR